MCVHVCRSGAKVMFYRGPSENPELPLPRKLGRRKAATISHATGERKRFLPQRLFLVVTINTIGACGPAIFQKPIPGLGKEYIVVILFRNISIYPSSSPDQQAQLWLYDPALVPQVTLWTKYYMEIVVPYVRKIRAHLELAPALTQVEASKPSVFAIGSSVLVRPKGAQKTCAREKYAGPYIVVEVKKEVYTLQELKSVALLEDRVPASRLLLVTQEIGKPAQDLEDPELEESDEDQDTQSS
jgi:hypothetical protein